ncbi:hypothetical protein CRP01_14400 [Flavilitoribacter nigricans DSM 23189 = NBRC 102662]|uniref:NADP-dependent oxidoreductase domain-containing protein n=2 Tax=Flavilitoribacter TaxID=2762562 RepID=A0A2D0NBD4_FLAN2|nr:hypothetical protein CRP01_14400 [Flavilitoribacter nigricans DSM 23189 = NBRC 102662]
MWGWTLSKAECFQLMDEFYRMGGRQVDAATNYPINKIPTDFRAAEQILLEWIGTHGITDLEVIMKVGSINNLRTPDHNLSKSFLLLNLDDYRHRFGSNLDTFMIHWDNRDDRTEIERSLEVLEIAVQDGLQAGLSGIRHPDIYAGLNEAFQLDFRIQVKHNLFQSDLDRYAPLQDHARFLAYGINAGGVKLRTDHYRPESNLIVRGGSAGTTPLHTKLESLIPHWNQRDVPESIRNFNQISMIYAYHHPKINGILIGPSRIDQLQSSLHFFGLLAGDAYRPVYQSLLDIQN